MQSPCPGPFAPLGPAGKEDHNARQGHYVQGQGAAVGLQSWGSAARLGTGCEVTEQRGQSSFELDPKGSLLSQKGWGLLSGTGQASS